MAKEVKNGRSKIYAMDGEALKKIFEKKGIDMRSFGEELGYHRTYFPKCIRTNRIGEKAIGMLMSKKIAPSQYGVEAIAPTKTVGEVFDSLPKETKDELYSEIGRAVEKAEKAPVEKAVEEPGVVKIELTLDMVKLKAIVKQAVKEAYEEI